MERGTLTVKMLRLIFLLVTLIAAIGRTQSWADDEEPVDVARQMRGLISAIRDESSEQTREELARQLLIYIKFNNASVDQAMIVDMANLLENGESMTRKYVLISMNYLGDRVVVVKPILERLLHATECHVWGDSSVPNIRDLLERIGEKVDRPTDCRIRYPLEWTGDDGVSVHND